MKRKDPFLVKVFLVILKLNTAKNGEPNRKIIDVKLSRKAAEAITNQLPGTYIERHVANRTEDLVSLFNKETKND